MKSYLHNILTSSRLVWFLSGFVLLVYLPFIGGVDLFDWDEVNFAEAAREMLASGEYGLVQINYESFWEKPPLFIWLQALFLKLFGVSAFAARFVNILVAIGTLLTVYRLGAKEHSKRHGLWWALFFLISLTPHFYFHTGLIDPLFNIFILGSIYMAYKGLKDRYVSSYAWSGVLLGLAVLTKGPVAGLIVLLVLGAYALRNKGSVHVKTTSVLAFVIPALLISSIWLLALIANGGVGLINSFFQYQLALLTQSVASHGQPWYYHFVVLLIGCFPASMLALKRFTQRNTSGLEEVMKVMFWVVLILFSLVTTKIVHYSSLCFFPLTYLAALQMTERSEKMSRSFKFFWYGMTVVVVLVLVVAPLLGYAFTADYLSLDVIQDQFARDVLHVAGQWSLLDIALGLLVGALLIVFSADVMSHRTRKWLLLGLPLSLSLYFYQVTKQVNKQLQRPIIAFYEGIQQENCYIETYKFKSYAHYFHSRIDPYQPEDALTKERSKQLRNLGVQTSADLSAYERIVYQVKLREWFIEGEVDKPVYLVCLNAYASELHKRPTMDFLAQYGPYSVFKRIP